MNLSYNKKNNTIEIALRSVALNPRRKELLESQTINGIKMIDLYPSDMLIENGHLEIESTKVPLDIEVNADAFNKNESILTNSKNEIDSILTKAGMPLYQMLEDVNNLAIKQFKKQYKERDIVAAAKLDNMNRLPDTLLTTKGSKNDKVDWLYENIKFILS